MKKFLLLTSDFNPSGIDKSQLTLDLCKKWSDLGHLIHIITTTYDKLNDTDKINDRLTVFQVRSFRPGQQKISSFGKMIYLNAAYGKCTDLIKQNREKYGPLSKAAFLCKDISQEVLPKADLILCRDCLVHFSYADIVRTIDNFKKSHSKYLLTTTFTDCIKNTDINTGDWRPINLEIAPLNFGEPIQTIVEECSERQGAFRDKSLGLWNISNL